MIEVLIPSLSTVRRFVSFKLYALTQEGLPLCLGLSVSQEKTTAVLEADSNHSHVGSLLWLPK